MPEPRHDAARSAPSNADDLLDPRSLEELIDSVEAEARKRPQLSVDDVLDAIGRRSFSPLILLPGLIMVAPIIGDIPGVPVLMGGIVILVAGQILLRHDHVWLPRFMLARSLSSGNVIKTMGWMRRPAQFVDRWCKPRMRWAVRHAAVYVIATVCILIAAATPIMEFVPFSANLAGIAISALGLALFAEDGYIALAAIGFTVATVALIVSQFV